MTKYIKEIQPVNQHVLPEFPEEKEQGSSGGFIIPDTVKEQPGMAGVVSMTDIDNPGMAAGDTVLIGKFAGTEARFDRPVTCSFHMPVFSPEVLRPKRFGFYHYTG